MAYLYFTASLVSYIKSFRKSDEGLRGRSTSNLPNYEAVIPARNEELNVRDCLLSLVSQEHRPKRVHIIDDKSTDKTLDVVLSTIKLFSGSTCYESSDALLGGFRFKLIKCRDSEIEYWVWSNIDKEPIGKGRSINALVLEGYIKEPYFLSVDADTLVDPHFAERTLEEMMKDPNLAAVYGYLFIVPEERTLIGRLYNEGFDVSSRISHVVFRSGSNVLGFHFTLSGPRVMFSTNIYKKCPRPVDTKAGDTAHAWELQARGYRIECVLNCYGISRMPSRLRGILKQRVNWHSGPFQNMYIRGVSTLRSLKTRGKKRFLGGLFAMFYYVFFSPAYHIKWGVVLPLLALLGFVSRDIAIRYYVLDYAVSLSFMIYSTIILRRYGYYRNNRKLDDFKKFNLFYFFFRPLAALVFTYCVAKFLRDVIKSKMSNTKPNWTGFT